MPTGCREASKLVMGPTPLVPFTHARQKASLPTPLGATTRSPVTTTLRMTVSPHAVAAPGVVSRCADPLCRVPGFPAGVKEKEGNEPPLISPCTTSGGRLDRGPHGVASVRSWEHCNNPAEDGQN